MVLPDDHLVGLAVILHGGRLPVVVDGAERLPPLASDDDRLHAAELQAAPHHHLGAAARDRSPPLIVGL